MSVKANQRTQHRQIVSQLVGKRKIPVAAMDREVGHGREITWRLKAKEAPDLIKEHWHGTSWIVEVTANGTREDKPFEATHHFITSLRTTPETLLQLVKERWSLESWQWIRDTQLRKDAHRYRGNGAGVMTALRPAALNLLRLAGYDSIREGIQAVTHDIKEKLAMVKPPRRKAARLDTLNWPCSGGVRVGVSRVGNRPQESDQILIGRGSSDFGDRTQN